MGRRLALIVGVNQYQDTLFRPLQFAENDARALAQWVVNARGGNWYAPDIQHVQGEHVTKDLMESLLTQLCMSMAGPDDLVFIYFAGHSFIDERTGDGYLAFANTRSQDPTTALHLPSFVHYLMARSRAAHILCMLDCFQTGPVWDTQRTSPYEYQPLLRSALATLPPQAQNRLFLCSCRGTDRAPEIGERGLGLLMYRTIVGLSGPARDATTGKATLQQLHAVLSNTLGEQQQPQLFGQSTSPLVLVGDMEDVTTPPQHASVSSFTAPSPGNPPYMDANQYAASPAYTASATAQLSPRPQQNTSGQLSSTIEQQCQMMMEQVQQFIQMQNPQEALNMSEHILRILPTYVPALTVKGQLLGTVGRYQEALTTIDQLIEVNSTNPLAWSMRAVVLTNIGLYEEALSAIDRSLALDANNPETYTIKDSIITSRAAAQSRAAATLPQGKQGVVRKRGGPRSFLIGVLIQLGGLGIGIVGTLLPIFQPTLPVSLSFALESLGIALLCVNAARGAFRHGFLRLLITLLLCLLPAAILGGAYKIGYTKIVAEINVHPTWLVPILFAVAWFALAAVLPLLLGIGGYIGGLVLGVRRRAK